MPLSRLQSQIARTVAALPEAEGFALAGGGALVVLGIVDRETQDLDYFAAAPDGAVDRLGPALERALADQGMSVKTRRRVLGFAEYQVSDGADVTAADLSWDARLYPPHAPRRGTSSTSIGCGPPATAERI